MCLGRFDISVADQAIILIAFIGSEVCAVGGWLEFLSGLG